MKIVGLLLFLFSISTNASLTNSIPKNPEECIYTFDNRSYRRSSILTIKGLPTNLAFNPSNNDLHFTLIDLESLHNEEVQTQMAQYVLVKGEPIKIDNVNGQAAAIDTKNDKVYIAADDGLNTLNSTYKANFVSLKDEDIVQLFKTKHNDDLFTILYPENSVYVVDTKRNEKMKVDNIPCAYILAVDTEDNIYFECDAKYMKVLIRGFEEPVEFVGISKNSARAVAVDEKNRVVLAANNGLYQLRADNVIPKKMMDLEFMPAGITFDGDNFYISTTDIIYKFTNDGC